MWSGHSRRAHDRTPVDGRHTHPSRCRNMAGRLVRDWGILLIRSGWELLWCENGWPPRGILNGSLEQEGRGLVLGIVPVAVGGIKRRATHWLPTDLSGDDDDDVGVVTGYDMTCWTLCVVPSSPAVVMTLMTVFLGVHNRTSIAWKQIGKRLWNQK